MLLMANRRDIAWLPDHQARCFADDHFGHDPDAQLYGRLANLILFAHAGLRTEGSVLLKCCRDSGLWGYAISDDLPIVLPLPVHTGKQCVSSTVFHAAEGACRPCRPKKATSKQWNPVVSALAKATGTVDLIRPAILPSRAPAAWLRHCLHGRHRADRPACASGAVRGHQGAHQSSPHARGSR